MAVNRVRNDSGTKASWTMFSNTFIKTTRCSFNVPHSRLKQTREAWGARMVVFTALAKMRIACGSYSEGSNREDNCKVTSSIIVKRQ